MRDRLLKTEEGWHPIPSELNDSQTIIVGEAPGKQEVQLKRPFVGPSGVEALRALKFLKKRRQDVAWGNVVACRFPRDEPEVFIGRLQKRNRRRKTRGQAPIPTPMECCQPRFETELAEYSQVIPMGAMATKAVLPGNPSLLKVRGAPANYNGKKVLPMQHPAYIIYHPMWKPIFREDVARAFRHFNNCLRWKNPEVNIHPSVEELADFIDRAGKKKLVVAYDVETDGIDAIHCGLRCIGLGTGDEVLVVPWLGINGKTRFYSNHDYRRLRNLLVRFFTHPKIMKIGHNAGYFDRMVIESHFDMTPKPVIDTILLHRLADNEMPHDLGFVASTLLDVPAWKADRTATTAETDKDLHTYCGTDVAVTHRIAKPILRRVDRRQQRLLFPIDTKMQELCVGMHKMGMLVNEERRMEWEETLLEQQEEHLIEVQTGVGFGINPNSPLQVGELLFDKWGLPPYDYTRRGDPSTNDATLRVLYGNPLLDARQKHTVGALRQYRKVTKLLTTYVSKLRRKDDLRENSQGDWVGGWTDVDGWVYPNYNAHGTSSGRFSSSDPNFQNIPPFLRDIFIAPEGYRFVYLDMDQLELRVAAALAGAQKYLDAFGPNLSIEPHSLTGELIFGQEYWALPGAPADHRKKGVKGSKFMELRDLAKTICFASLYGANAPKIWELVTSAEDRETGKLLFSHYSLMQIRALHRKWLRGVPEFEVWWDKTLQGWRRDGYVVEPIFGRRRDFADGEDFNAIVNFPVQAAGFAIVVQGMMCLMERIPFNFKERTGFCTQTHDAVLLLEKESRVEETMEIVEEAMTQEALGMLFTGKAKSGKNWGELG